MNNPEDRRVSRAMEWMLGGGFTVFTSALLWMASMLLEVKESTAVTKAQIAPVIGRMDRIEEKVENIQAQMGRVETKVATMEARQQRVIGE